MKGVCGELVQVDHWGWPGLVQVDHWARRCTYFGGEGIMGLQNQARDEYEASSESRGMHGEYYPGRDSPHLPAPGCRHFLRARGPMPEAQW